MSLRPHESSAIPEGTAHVARAAFPKGHRLLRLRDELDTLYTDAPLATLFPPTGRPAEAPWRLALVTVLQFAEGSSDRQAADAVRTGRVLYFYGSDVEHTPFDALRRGDRVEFATAPDRRGRADRALRVRRIAARSG